MVQVPPPVLIGLIIGGMFAVVALGSVTIVLLLRKKHKRAVQSMDAAGARRLSGYPGGNVNMAWADLNDVPRTRGRLRKSTVMPPLAYAAISSHESLPRRQVSTKAPRALTSNRAIPDPFAYQRSYPLPPRLTSSRSNMIPLDSVGRIRSSSLASPRVDSSQGSPSRVREGKVSPRTKVESRNEVEVNIPTGAPRLDISPNAALRPKPLSINKKRSVSFSTITKPFKPQRKLQDFM